LEASGQELGRRLSTAVVMFHQAIAEQFGMNATDFKCGDILSRTGPITAGELARLTGMDTGTLTTVIDRLEAAGFARRRRDPHDRRKVIVEPLPGRQHEVDQVFASLGLTIGKLTAGYSPEEIALITGFLTRMVSAVEEETVRLREQAAATRKQRRREAAEG